MQKIDLHGIDSFNLKWRSSLSGFPAFHLRFCTDFNQILARNWRHLLLRHMFTMQMRGPCRRQKMDS